MLTLEVDLNPKWSCVDQLKHRCHRSDSPGKLPAREISVPVSPLRLNTQGKEEWKAELARERGEAFMQPPESFPQAPRKSGGWGNISGLS